MPFARGIIRFLVVLLVVTLVAGPAPRDDEPWLEIVPRNGDVVVNGTEGRAEAIVHLTLSNRFDRLVRVQRVRIDYLEDGLRVASESPGREFFTRDTVTHPFRINRNGREEWLGVCLRSPPAGADQVRFVLDLGARRRLVSLRSTQSVELNLRAVSDPPQLGLPFSGYWRVTQGHTCESNHRLGGYGTDFAWDFVALSPATGRPVNEHYEITLRNRDTVSFGMPILSPADGKVVRIENTVPDNEGLREYPRRSLLEDLGQPLWKFGNFVILDIGADAYVLLGHLAQGSVSVLPGDRIRAGQPIARCGNSGNSIDPHLHMQVMDHPDPAEPSVRGIPARFRDYTELSVSVDGEVRSAVSIRRPGAGDPPFGAVVSSTPPDERGPAEAERAP